MQTSSLLTRLNRVSYSDLTPARISAAVVAIAVLLASIILANWVTTDYGFIPVGLGFEATAGTFFAGFALAARDAIQDTVGRLVVVAVIVAGAVLSFAISAPAIAVASAVAFLTAELFDFTIYTKLREKARLGDLRWAGAVVFSNVAGALTDTVVFLGIAFGSAAIMPALPGQMVGKLWATLAYLLIGFVVAKILQKSPRK